ncbi:MAG: CPBP family intramembrane metalloprotease [Methanomicrobiales archaeon]|nr:CPBP family intramembrane metalloprotease [Methanomicrobiales archaeon]MDI6877363.1 CPBP family intramembrane metalloprotease [Methanomicrobiales archaeon]
MRRGIAAYLILAFGIAWALWIPLWLLWIPASRGVAPLAFIAGAFAPAIAAAIVRLVVTRDGFADAALAVNLRRAWPYYLFAGLWPFLVLAGIPALSFVLGGAVGALSLPPEALPGLLDAPRYGALLLNALILTPLFFGEEFGWRGYLQIRLFGDRPLLAAISTGAIWGVWQLPAVLAGYLPNQHGLLSLVSIPVYMILFSIVLGWLRLRAESVWAPSLAHSANTTIVPRLGAILPVGSGYGDLFFLPAGLLFLGALGLLCIGIVAGGGLASRKRR